MFASKCTELKSIKLSEVSQARKDKGHMFSLIHGRQIQKINVFTKSHMIMYTFKYRAYLQ
jgi:hypothetical protein